MVHETGEEVTTLYVKRLVVAVTGASGGAYAVRLLDCLENAGVDIHLIVSPFGKKLLADECGITRMEPEAFIGRPSNRLTMHDYLDLACELASGSFLTSGMVICPCSSNTLGVVSAGLGNNLVARAACVTLKEARRLIVVHREMPVSSIDLENMLRLQRAGAIICPASPGFYMQPQTVDDLVDFVVGRILDLVDVEHQLATRWNA